MLIFLIFVAFYSIVFLCELYFPISKKAKVILILPLWVSLPIIAGLNTTSPDYLNYIEIFREIGTLYDLLIGSGVMSREPLFSTLVALVNSLSYSEGVIFWVISFISVSISLYILLNCSPYIGLSVCLYLIHPFLNKEMIQIRAGLATAFIFLFIYLLAKRHRASLGAFIVASGIHFSSIVCLIPYLIYKLSRKISIVYLVNMMLTISVVFYIIGVKDVLLTTLFELGLLPQKVGIYLFWEKYNYSLGLINPIILKLTVLHFLLYYVIKKENPHNEIIKVGFIFNGFSLSWLLFFNDFAILAARIASITSVAELVLIPLVISTIKVRQKYIVWLVLVIYFFLVVNVNIYITKILPFLDYRLI